MRSIIITYPHFAVCMSILPIHTLQYVCPYYLSTFCSMYVHITYPHFAVCMSILPIHTLQYVCPYYLSTLCSMYVHITYPHFAVCMFILPIHTLQYECPYDLSTLCSMYVHVAFLSTVLVLVAGHGRLWRRGLPNPTNVQDNDIAIGDPDIILRGTRDAATQPRCRGNIASL